MHALRYIQINRLYLSFPMQNHRTQAARTKSPGGETKKPHRTRDYVLYQFIPSGFLGVYSKMSAFISKTEVTELSLWNKFGISKVFSWVRRGGGGGGWGWDKQHKPYWMYFRQPNWIKVPRNLKNYLKPNVELNVLKFMLMKSHHMNQSLGKGNSRKKS